MCCYCPIFKQKKQEEISGSRLIKWFVWLKMGLWFKFQLVKPFVKTNKNNSNDAEAIVEAARYSFDTPSTKSIS